MAPGYSISKNITFSGFVGFQLGEYTNAAGQTIATDGVFIGGQIKNNKGTYGKLSTTVGTVIGADAQIGQKFDLSKKLNVDLSLNASAIKAVYTDSFEDGVVKVPYSPHEWKPGMLSAGIGANLNYNVTPGLSLSAGVETGIEKSLAPNVMTKNNETIFKGKRTETYTNANIVAQYAFGENRDSSIGLDVGITLGKKENNPLVSNIGIFDHVKVAYTKNF